MSTDPNQVVIDRAVAERLVEHALNEIYMADQDEGCCPGCCAPCAAIDGLLMDGQLDDLVHNRAHGSVWWNAAAGAVDREWLRVAWRRVDCHAG